MLPTKTDSVVVFTLTSRTDTILVSSTTYVLHTTLQEEFFHGIKFHGNESPSMFHGNKLFTKSGPANVTSGEI